MRCRVWKEESRQWEGDEDDFDALHQTWWGRNAYVEGGAVIMLRRLGEGGEPGAGLWARYGRVAESVREDVHGVVIHLREERSREWCAHEQVHVDLRDRQFGALFAGSKNWGLRNTTKLSESLTALMLSGRNRARSPAL